MEGAVVGGEDEGQMIEKVNGEKIDEFPILNDRH